MSCRTNETGYRANETRDGNFDIFRNSTVIRRELTDTLNDNDQPAAVVETFGPIKGSESVVAADPPDAQKLGNLKSLAKEQEEAVSGQKRKTTIDPSKATVEMEFQEPEDFGAA